MEEVLKYHQESGTLLEVTHTVSVEDVKANIEAWAPSATKEFDNLKDNKHAFEVASREQLPRGCRIFPGKGVSTVKPDKRGFRRKTQFVACGNYMDGEAEGVQSLYAAGLDASSLRTVLSVASARSSWKVAIDGHSSGIRPCIMGWGSHRHTASGSGTEAWSCVSWTALAGSSGDLRSTGEPGNMGLFQRRRVEEGRARAGRRWQSQGMRSPTVGERFFGVEDLGRRAGEGGEGLLVGLRR